MMEIQKSNKKLFPCLWQAALLLCGIFFVTVVLTVGAEIIKFILKDNIPDSLLINIYCFLTGTITFVCLTIPAIGILFITKASLKKFFHFKNLYLSYFIPTIIMIFGLAVINTEMSNYLRMIMPMPEFIKEIFKILFSCNPLVLFYIIIFVASVSEELIFRGVILRGFLSHYSANKSILISAALFSVYHLNPYQMMAAFLLGLVIGWIYVKTKSIWYCIFCHALNNFMAFIAIYMPFKISGWNYSPNENSVSNQPLWFNILGIIAFIIGSITLYYFINNNAKVDDVESDFDDDEPESEPEQILPELEQTPI